MTETATTFLMCASTTGDAGPNRWLLSRVFNARAQVDATGTKTVALNAASQPDYVA